MSRSREAVVADPFGERKSSTSCTGVPSMRAPRTATTRENAIAIVKMIGMGSKGAIPSCSLPVSQPK